MKTLFSRLALAVLWLLHRLPLPLLRALGAMLGGLLYVFGHTRRRIVLTNLRLCFPDLTNRERKRLARRHFVAFARAFLDRSLLWWAPRERLERLIRLKGREHLHDPAGRPIILFCPHFVGLDAGGAMMTMTVQLVSVYSNQKNPVFNAVLLAGRLRFNEPILLSRQDGMRRALRALKDGHPFFYLPDMDFGRRDAIFVPFFGVPAATITGLSRLARAAGACVVPVLTRLTAEGYDVELMPPWQDYPGESIEADTLRMNQWIEQRIAEMPEQYFWLHRRFKTRPKGERRLY